MEWTPNGLTNSSLPSLALHVERHPERSVNCTAANPELPLIVTDVWKQPTSNRQSCTNYSPQLEAEVSYDAKHRNIP